MTFFGIIWMLMIMYSFTRNSIHPFLTLLLFSMLFQCNNVIQIGDITCGPQLITSFCFNIRFFMQKKHVVKREKDIIEDVLVFLTIYVIIQSSIFIGRNSIGMLLKYFQLLSYTITFICVGNVSRDIEMDYLYKTIRSLTMFVLCIGCLQIAVNVLGIPKNNPLQYLIYNDTTGGISYYKDLNRFYSTFMEPSYCAGLLVGLLFFYLETFSEQATIHHKRILIIGIIIAIIITFSPTAYGAVAVISLFYVYTNRNKRQMWLLIPIGIVLIGIGFETGFFGSIINAKLNSKSGVTRNLWNENAIEYFKSSPIIGNGYKSSRASSIVYTLLAELGIIGFSLFCILTISITKYVRASNRLICGGSMIVLANIVAGVIACPDLDLCSLWLSLFIFSICKNIKQQEECKLPYSCTEQECK